MDSFLKEFNNVSIVALVALICFFVFLVFITNQNKIGFEKVCTESNSITVWDGRQYQCIKKEGNK